MKFPSEFSTRFPTRRLIYSKRDTFIWLVYDSSARSYVLKTIPLDKLPAPEVLRILERFEHINVVVPLKCHARGGWCHQLLQYFPLGSLDEPLNRNGALSPSDCEAVLRQMVSIFGTLHGQDGQKPIIHGDIKPSNILLRSDRQGWRQYFLSDFGASMLLNESGSNSGLRSRRRYTLRYAAPEMVGGGTLTPAVDYWSLGMVLFECLTGRHPIPPDTKPDVIRTLLSSNWRPTFDKEDDVDYHWRALFGGLFDRNPYARWGHREISLWIARDPGVISAGLIKAGGTARTPFMVGDTPAYNATDLAKALLHQWDEIR